MPTNLEQEIGSCFHRVFNVDQKTHVLPTKEDVRFAVELEWVDSNRNRISEEISSNRLNWRVVGDASLYNHDSSISESSTGETYPNSNNKLYYKRPKLVEIEKVANIVSRRGGIASDHCGLHVHVDGSWFVKNGQFSRLITNVFNVQDFFVKMINMREAGFLYSRPIPETYYKTLKKSKTLSELKNNWYDTEYMRGILDSAGNSCWTTDRGGHYNATRYTLINLHPFFTPRGGSNGTVEFRPFNGSLDPDTIKTYISFCLNIVLNSLDLDSKLMFNKKINSFLDFKNACNGILDSKEIEAFNNIYKGYMDKNKINYKKVGKLYIPNNEDVTKHGMSDTYRRFIDSRRSESEVTPELRRSAEYVMPSRFEEEITPDRDIILRTPQPTTHYHFE